MGYALPIEVYDAIKKVVKDEKTAREIARAIEEGLEAIEEKAKKEKVVLKAEIKDELRKELASKEDIALLEQKIETVRQELKGEIEAVRHEIKGEIRELRAYMKFIIVIMLLGFTFLNPQFYDFLKMVLGMVK